MILRRRGIYEEAEKEVREELLRESRKILPLSLERKHFFDALLEVVPQAKKRTKKRRP
jgi:hypothetical protein